MPVTPFTTTPNEKQTTSASVEQSKERLFYQQPIYRGHTLYEIDITEKTVRVMPIEDIAVYNPNGFSPISTQRKVVTKPNCVYTSCLNVTNLKKLIDNADGKDISNYTYILPSGETTPLHTRIKGINR